MTGTVVAVSHSATHSMSKPTAERIVLLPGLGVEGDAHQGTTVKHRSRVKRDPNQPNLRQVHLIHSELHDELREAGFDLLPGQMGENITTRGVPLLELPVGTRLHLGARAVVELTGRRSLTEAGFRADQSLRLCNRKCEVQDCAASNLCTSRGLPPTRSKRLKR